MDNLKETIKTNTESIRNRISALKAHRVELESELESVNNAIMDLQGRASQNDDILKFMEQREKEVVSLDEDE